MPVAGSAYTFSLREPGRADRLDHRVGPHPRAGAGCERRSRRVGPVLPGGADVGAWHAHPRRGSRRPPQPGRRGDRAAADGAAVRRDSRVEHRQRRDRGDQAGDHPARDRRGAVVHPHRQLPPVHPAGADRSRRPAAARAALCFRTSGPRPARSAWRDLQPAPRSCSSRSSASTSSRPTPRRPRSRSATCRIGIFVLADDLHAAVRRRVARRDRDGQVQPHRRRRRRWRLRSSRSVRTRSRRSSPTGPWRGSPR